MLWYALKMLVGEKAKYISIVLGLSFASFIISQQSAILTGIIKRTFGFVKDTSQANIWVSDPSAQYIDDIKPLKDTALYRVRGVEGIEWAMPLYKGNVQIRLPSGIFQTCVLIGIDGGSLIGGPPKMIQGSLEDLRIADAIIVDKVGAETKLASDHRTIPLKIGDTMEINDHHAVVVGICQASRTFQSQPVIYTTYDRATTFVPAQRKLLSFVIAHSKSGVNLKELCERIEAQTGLKASSTQDLEYRTLMYYIKYTGIFVNFGVAILLGFIIGTAIAGQTLYNFTIDNPPFFAVFKAMGASNALLTKIVLLQALFVSAIGWGIGMGAAALFAFITAGTELSFNMPFLLYIMTGVSILLISLFSAYICVRRVVSVDPAIVFKS